MVKRLRLLILANSEPDEQQALVDSLSAIKVLRNGWDSGTYRARRVRSWASFIDHLVRSEKDDFVRQEIVNSEPFCRP